MKRNNQSGLTLIELIIGMLMFVLIFMVSSALIILVISTNSKLRRTEALEQAKNDIASDISSTLKWGTNIAFGDGFLAVDDVTYRLQDGEVVKNGNSLVPSDVEVYQFEVLSRSANPSLVGLTINVGLRHRKFDNVNENFTLTVSQREREFATNEQG